MADDDTRAQILAAALAILGEEDQHALTVRRVAARAGCSTIGVYTWFGSKDGLVDAILAEGLSIRRTISGTMQACPLTRHCSIGWLWIFEMEADRSSSCTG